MKKNLINRPFPRIDLIFKNFIFLKRINKQLIFFRNGREALIFGLKILGIKKGSTILIPAFICNSFSEFIIFAGYKVRYIDINQDMSLDINVVENIFKSEDIKAIVFIYYFGLPFEIKPFLSLCQKYRVKIVEDCSHGFQTKVQGKNIGTFGDMAIYSLRKVLPISDGGALRLNNSKKKEISTSYKFSFENDFIYFFTRIIEALVRNYLQINIYSKRFLLIKNKIKKHFKKNKSKNDYVSNSPQKHFSCLLNIFLNNNKYLLRSLNTRKKNFNFLLNEIESIGLKSYVESINKDCSPQFFIIEDNYGGLSEWLIDNGIGAMKWPGEELPREIELSPNLYINANNLNSKLVMLPVHQDIKTNDYKELISLLNKWTMKNSF